MVISGTRTDDTPSRLYRGAPLADTSAGHGRGKQAPSFPGRPPSGKRGRASFARRRISRDLHSETTMRRSAVPRIPFAVLGLLPALVALSLGARAGHAQGWIHLEHPDPGVPTGPVERVGSTVRMTVEGRVARVEVKERFRNTGGIVAEGSYMYPLPGEAVFANFSLWSGDQELKGETMRAEEARRIYEEIVRR